MSTPLAEDSRMDWLRTRRPRIQMPAWVGTAVPHRRTLPTSWSRGSSPSLIVHRTWLSTVSDRAFLVAAALIWNNLQQHVTSVPSLHAFASRLKTHFFSVSFSEQFWIRHSDRSSYLLSVCACLFLYYYAVFFTSLLLLGFDVIKMKSEWLLCVSAMSVATMCWTTTRQMISRLYAATLSPLRHKDNWRLPALTVETDSCCVHVP